MTGATDESKAENIRVMGPELGAVYSALWQQLAWVHIKWSEYVVLFGTKEDRVNLMNDAAPSFTRTVQDTLWESVLLHIARLTDPPRTGRRENLSMMRLPALIGDKGVREKVQERIDAAAQACEFCRDWRNRHIAHGDYHLALDLSAEPLKLASRLKVREALDSLLATLNEVQRHYLGSTTIMNTDVEGGALSLLYVVDSGLEAERAKMERLRAGQYSADDFKQRDI